MCVRMSFLVCTVSPWRHDVGSLTDISPFGEDCELPLFSFSQRVIWKKRCWGGQGEGVTEAGGRGGGRGQYEESNGRLVWLSSAMAVETKQMNCEMYSKRLETSACQQPLHLSSFPPPFLQDPSLSISPLLFLSDTLKKSRLDSSALFEQNIKKRKCYFHPFFFSISYSGRCSAYCIHINCEILHDKSMQCLSLNVHEKGLDVYNLNCWD